MIPYDELSSSFQARHLAVDLDDAYKVSPEMRTALVISELRERHFDQAPVYVDHRPTGFVLMARLETSSPDAPIAASAVPIAPGNVVSADASIGSLLSGIEGPGMLFVVDGLEFTGFITVSDFNKQPARTYLFLLLATLETGLAELVRRRFHGRQSDILALLPTDTGNEIHAMYEADVIDNVDSDVVAYLTLSNLRNIVCKDPELLRSVGATSRTRWEQETGSLIALRNEVMHSTRSLVTRKAGLIRLRELDESLRSVVVRVQRALAPAIAEQDHG